MSDTMTDSVMQKFFKSTSISGNNAAYVEDLYDCYLIDPNSIDASWATYFDGLKNSAAVDVSRLAIEDAIRQAVKQKRASSAGPAGPTISGNAKQEAVDHLIHAYRRLGHFAAKLDPLGRERRDDPRLHLDYYGLSEADFNEQFLTRDLLKQSTASLKEIYQTLVDLYATHIGYEYEHMIHEEEREWVRDYIERKMNHFSMSAEDKLNLLKELTAAEGLENYLDKKYVGQKRFSVQGGESIIPLINETIKRARHDGVKEVIIGMAHRGRLNVLINVMGQSPVELFKSFEGKKDYGMTSGDVKYHMGFSSDRDTPDGPVHLSLAFNPSHLEVIGAVAEGSVRARQDNERDVARNRAMPILIHGDSAFTGQGVVMETLNLSQTRGYTVGGTVHIVLNNQVGFTTSCHEDVMSGFYQTDIAKMINVPIIHVNADDPEAVIFAGQLALDFRMKFHKDVVIDLVCYRRYGHNEADEPRATQPMMYQFVDARDNIRVLYGKKLVEEKTCDASLPDEMLQAYRDKLDNEQNVLELLSTGLVERYHANWAPYMGKGWREAYDTSIKLKTLQALAKKLIEVPAGFELQRQIKMLVANRTKMANGELPLDWGFAETLAYASLAVENHPVRLTGQDSRRGTFAHRQSALFDQKTGQAYMPLCHVSETQAPVCIYDSTLSEMAVLGFEYGYSASDPETLVLWEAQFGDFANGAQMVIDQFISSAWQKWQRLSGIVMLLPHGYEGMGPEHTSARLERFLQMSAEDNMQICIPSTPAQIFHLLRRQVIRKFRAPLIVFTPKSMLRNKLAVSSLEDLATGSYQLVIPEVDDLSEDKVTKVIVCSGKLYYELLTKRREDKREDVAIIRLEQLYPFPETELTDILTQYMNSKKVVWCQEEPQNQGAWYNSRHRLLRTLSENQTLLFVGRKSSASPAAGYPALHKKQQQQLLDDAFDI